MGAAFTPQAMQSYVPRVLATCEAHLTRMASQERTNLNDAVSRHACSRHYMHNTMLLHQPLATNVQKYIACLESYVIQHLLCTGYCLGWLFGIQLRAWWEALAM